MRKSAYQSCKVRAELHRLAHTGGGVPLLHENGWPVETTDPGHFPIRIFSRIALYKSRRPLRICLKPLGSCHATTCIRRMQQDSGLDGHHLKTGVKGYSNPRNAYIETRVVQVQKCWNIETGCKQEYSR
jgi:hypothetical protein